MENELYHYGVKGMKWGVRRYRNEDGSLTAAGKKRESKTAKRILKKDIKDSLKNAAGYEKRSVKRTDKSEIYSKMGKEYLERANVATKFLNKIETGVVEAGKDYITTTKWSMKLDLLYGAGLTKTQTLDTNDGIHIRRTTTYYG